MRPTSWLDIRLRLASEHLWLIARVVIFLLLFYLGAGLVGTNDLEDAQLAATIKVPR